MRILLVEDDDMSRDAVTRGLRSAGFAVDVAVDGGEALAYLMVVENMIGLAAENAVDWMPGGVLGAVAAGGTATVAYGTALVLAAVYAAAGLAGAALTVRRRTS